MSAISSSSPTLPSLLVVAMLLGVGCSISHAEPPGAPPACSATQVAASELIVKFTPQTGRLIEQARAQGLLPTQLGIAWLDALNFRYGVSDLRPVFRVPPGAEVAALRYVYVLALRANTPVLQAAQDYAESPEVIYAQPKCLTSTQGGNSLP